MRIVPSLLLVGAVGLALACNRENLSTAGPHKVIISLTCDNDGGKIGVQPWRVRSLKSESIKWTVAQNNTTVSLEPKDPAQWPFVSAPPITVSNANPVTSSDFKNLTPGDSIFPYKVTGVCNHHGQMNKVVLDPDMIIPN